MSQTTTATTQSPAPPRIPTLTLTEAARLAYSEAKGNIKRSSKALRGVIENNPALLGEVIEAAVHNEITYQMRKHRERFFRGTQMPTKEPKSAKEALIRHGMMTWFSYPLRNGDCLGNVSRGRLVEEAGVHNAMARGNLVKERLFLAIAAQMPDDEKKVFECVTEEEIENIARGGE